MDSEDCLDNVETVDSGDCIAGRVVEMLAAVERVANVYSVDSVEIVEGVKHGVDTVCVGCGQ